MNVKKSFWSKKLGIIGGTLLASALLVTAVALVVTNNVDNYRPIVEKPDAVILVSEPLDDVEEWQVIARINSYDFFLGDNDPGGDDSGWICTFMLNYTETPTTCLLSNGTGAVGYYNTWTNVSGFVDADNTDIDLASESGAYFVIRCRFNDTVKDGSDFIASRCRLKLTVSGDETLSSVIQKGDNSNTTGGGVVSHNVTTDPYIYINFFYDDNSDGYRILDDGSLVWSIVIEARY